ncbi:MAG TPA: hypothetical protein VMS11_08760 [Solirubrobacterales bacterium]|nr:hypothetical protein [Solirubrobacterales bacterium]
MGSPLFQADGVTDRPGHRLTTLYSLKIDNRSIAALDLGSLADANLASHLRFGRLAVHYQGAGDQFPVVLVSEEVKLPCDGPRNAGSMQIRRSRLWLFKTPQGGLVAGQTLDFSGPLADSIPLLEDAYYGEITTGSGSLLGALGLSAGPDLAPHLEAAQLGTHSHQLLFVPDSCEDLVASDGHSSRQVDHDLVRRLIYRYDAPYRPDSGLIVFPPETNRRIRALAACGPYFSVLASQQDYLENCALVTAVQLVGCANLLATTRAEAFEALTDLRSLQAEVDAAKQIEHRQVRRRLARLSERVGRLELDLSFGVEAYQEIAALVPSLRVSDLHRQLFDSAAIPEQSRSIDQMLRRLGRAVAAESASEIATERSRDERRRLAWGVAIGFASFVAIPLTLIFGFFALATTDVSRESSLFDLGRYKWFYAVVAGVMVITLCLSLAAWWSRRDRDD